MSKKKKLILAIFALCWFLISAPTNWAQASVPNILLSAVNGLASLFAAPALLSVSATLNILLGFAHVIMLLQTELLEWALGNPFSYSLTNPGGNPVIMVGWTLLRDLTNMLFVLGLAYIGLATALNLGGFNTKKTFGRLIVAALLINFTPVICGVIVDASNIIMRFFTTEVGNNFNAFSIVYGDKGGFNGWDILKTNFTLIGLTKIFSALVFTGLVSGILFIFTFILLARHVAIWLLVILSPIAFFCWIFDSTKKHFRRWWQEFLNWSFIGALAGFALYLSGYLLNAFKKGGLTSTTTVFSSDFNVFSQLLPYFIVLLFMGFSYIQVVKVSATGGRSAVQAAQFVGGKIKSGSKKLGQYGLSKARNAALKAEEKRGPGTGSRLGGALRWFTGRGTPEEEKDWGSNLFKRTLRAWVGGTGLTGMATRYGLAKASEAQTHDMAEAAGKAGESMEKNVAALKKAMGLGQLGNATAILNKMISNGNYKFSDYAKSQLSKIMTHAVKNNPLEVLSNMRYMDPLLSEQLAKELKGKASEVNLQKAGLWMSDEDLKNKRYKGSLSQKLFSVIKPATIENWSRETAEKYMEYKEDGTGFVYNVGTGAHIQKIGEVFGRDMLDKFSDKVSEQGFYKKFVENGNMALGRWVLSGPAAGLGISYDDNDTAKEFFKGEGGKISPEKKEEFKRLKEKSQKEISEETIQEGMLKYRTEQQLKREEYKAKETAALESQKVEALKGIKEEEGKTREEIKRLGEKIEQAGEKKEKAEEKRKFYGPIAEAARTVREEKQAEAAEVGRRSFWTGRPKYPETTIKKEGRQEKKLTARAAKEGKSEIKQIKREARRQQKAIRKQQDSQEGTENPDDNT